MPNNTLRLRPALDALLAALRETLTPRQYEVYRLHECAGLSGKEIAHRLGIHPSVASHHLTAAREQIRRAYEKI